MTPHVSSSSNVPCNDWIAPPPGQLKLNSDVALHGGAGSVGVGVAIRDVKGKVIAALSKPLGENFSSVIGDFLALREGLLLAKYHSILVQTAEVDSSLFASSLNSSVPASGWDYVEFGESDSVAKERSASHGRVSTPRDGADQMERSASFFLPFVFSFISDVDKLSVLSDLVCESGQGCRVGLDQIGYEEEENLGNIKQQLANLFDASIRETFPNEPVTEPLVVASSTRHSDYQCNNAMGIFSKIQGKYVEYQNVASVGQAILRNLPESEMIESSSIGGPGFVNVVLSNNWIAENIQKMLVNGIETWAPRLHVRKAVVDFSSPNIAKEMHVGHLRSTVIGHCIARMLEFSSVEVLRRNHVGDWGTQFGMLIENLFDKFPSVEDFNETAIGDLQAFYKESKQRFDEDPAFKARAQQAVVRLQGGEPKYRQVWMQICDISRKEFDKVYNRLGVELEEKGESFYNPYIPRVIEALTNQGLVEENEGARVIWIEGYRLNEEQADWIIYVTDVGQQEHFDKVFSAAKRAGWLSGDNRAYPKASHVGFGLVLGEDGKRFRTRSSEVVRLVDLLDEAKSRMLKESKKNQDKRGILWTDEELEQISEPVGIAAIKYADLKSNRLTNYTFSFQQMLNTRGNTAVSLLYAHARIFAMIEKSEQNIQELKKTGSIVLDHANERALGLHLLRFSEAVEESCSNLMPHTLCDYLFNLSEYFRHFYDNCKVVGSAEETSRLLLCEATLIVIRKCFNLLGIVALNRI
ncbi:hypothetical protein Dsin_000922 [Dipteronia sinensis]|uniref:arginine--tRNA ligase n=1 Tax=Dipteronia sinensis TaxID=43782 RepID=A0AAE0EHY6_9ROSI|nr:hypothetical protein Dsin_000922 [Dipteronia sinensis]